MNDLRPLIQKMIDGWRHEQIPILPGVSDQSISSFESKYEVKLPRDMKEFFSAVNGMGCEYDKVGFFRFWPLEEVEPIRTHSPELTKLFPELASYFLFFDHSIELFMYAAQMGDSDTSSNTIVRVYPQEKFLSYERVFGSFTEFASAYVNVPDRLI